VIELLDSKGIDTTVLVPSNFSPDKDEEYIFRKKKITLREIDSLAKLKMNPRSTLFIPLLAVAKMSIIDQIKRNNPNCKVYITIHGVRRLDLKYDKYDKYYFDGPKRVLYPLIGRSLINLGNVIYRLYLRKYMPKYDKVFTVSNATLQQLIKIGSPQYIKWFYQGGFINRITSENIKLINEKYILFLSGNRPEKNLLRFMLAFTQYKKNNLNDIHLYVTGLNENTKKNLLTCKQLDSSIVNNWVSFFSYVSDDELNILYHNAIYIVYPSKSEGFGLPVEEAIMRGIPVIASYITSIPEVADSTITYMNPYSINSMSQALEKMNSKEIDRQLLAISDKKKIAIERIEQSNNDLVSELIEYEYDERYGE
jgi:glycosyltransferase involved in cell wall biosynthesis